MFGWRIKKYSRRIVCHLEVFRITVELMIQNIGVIQYEAYCERQRCNFMRYRACFYLTRDLVRGWETSTCTAKLNEYPQKRNKSSSLWWSFLQSLNALEFFLQKSRESCMIVFLIIWTNIKLERAWCMRQGTHSKTSLQQLTLTLHCCSNFTLSWSYVWEIGRR